MWPWDIDFKLLSTFLRFMIVENKKKGTGTEGGAENGGGRGICPVNLTPNNISSSRSPTFFLCPLGSSYKRRRCSRKCKKLMTRPRAWQHQSAGPGHGNTGRWTRASGYLMTETSYSFGHLFSWTLPTTPEPDKWAETRTFPEVTQLVITSSARD